MPIDEAAIEELVHELNTASNRLRCDKGGRVGLDDGKRCNPMKRGVLRSVDAGGCTSTRWERPGSSNAGGFGFGGGLELPHLAIDEAPCAPFRLISSVAHPQTERALADLRQSRLG